MNRVSENSTRFKVVYDEVFPIVIRLVWRITGDQEIAEELCHDAFIKLYDRLDSFPDNNQAKYWMIRVCKNHALNHVKRKQRERKAYERVLVEPKREIKTGEELVMNEVTREMVRKALEKLPPKMKEVLMMKEYGELNYRDIGKILGISEANVKVRVFRARQKLGELLQEEGIGYGL